MLLPFALVIFLFNLSRVIIFFDAWMLDSMREYVPLRVSQLLVFQGELVCNTLNTESPDVERLTWDFQ